MSKILNNVLCTLMIFALTFLWVYFSVKSVIWAVCLALIVALCFCYILWRAQSRIDVAKNSKNKNKKAAANFCEFLKFNDDNASLFCELFRFYNFDVSAIDYENFIAKKNDVKYYVAICFENGNLTAERLRLAVVSAKREKADKLYVFTPKAEQSQIKTASKYIPCIFVDAANAYLLFEQCDKLPSIPDVKQTKTSFVAKYAFSKGRFGWYFGSSLFMLLISVVAYFPYYTLAWATVMMGLALYSLLNTRFNGQKTSVSLD